jgi:hypothetical protein
MKIVKFSNLKSGDIVNAAVWQIRKNVQIQEDNKNFIRVISVRNKKDSGDSMVDISYYYKNEVKPREEIIPDGYCIVVDEDELDLIMACG